MDSDQCRHLIEDFFLSTFDSYYTTIIVFTLIMFIDT